MKRLIIICEGPTEQAFCKDVIQPHLLAKGVIIQTPTIKKSRGGIVAWTDLKRQIENHLNQDKTAHVTTLIDYYGIKDKHAFPNWDTAKTIVNKNERMSYLEEGMIAAIDPPIAYRFIPYIQLHEFEGLLFNNITAFESQLTPEEFIDKAGLEATIANNSNSELINDTPNNAPSYRLQRHIKGYNKIVYGAIIAQAIGLPKIRAKNPRFKNWCDQIEGI